MPKILPEVDTYPASVSVPVDGDVANGAAIEAPVKALTYRTLWLKGQVDAMGTRAGVTRLREATDKAALLAFPVIAGDLAYLVGVGLYRFTTAAVAGGAEPMVFEAPAQGGRWVNLALNHDTLTPGGPVWANASGLATVKGLAADAVGTKALVVGEGATFAGAISKVSGGYTKERVMLGPDADATYSPDEVDVVTCFGATSDRVYTLVGDAGRHHGAIIRVAIPQAVAAEIVVKDGNNAAPITTLGNSGVTSPGYNFGTFLFQNWSGPKWTRIG